MFELRPGPTLADAEPAYQGELAGWDEQIEQVVESFLRVTDKRLVTVVASVHLVAEQLRARCEARETSPPGADEVVAELERGKVRGKLAGSDDEIAQALRTLRFLGWLSVEPRAPEDLSVPEGTQRR
jgi:hypothetical protein